MSSPFILALILGMLIVGLLGLTFLDLLVRRPVPAAAVVLWLIVLTALLPGSVMSIELGGFRVSLSDLGLSFVAFAAILRLLRTRGTSPAQRVLIFLGLLTVVSLLLGVVSQGADAAVNEFRSYLSFLGPALYFSTVAGNRDTRSGILRAWFGAGVGIAVVVVLRWAGQIAGIPLGVFEAAYDAVIRVLDGPQTMFVATCAMVLVLPGLEPGATRFNKQRYLGIALLLMTIVLNRRTVWLALAVALLALLLQDRRIGRRVTMVATAGLILFVAILPVFSSGDSDRAIAQSVTDAGTLTWRLEGWSDLLESGPDEAGHYVIGQPFGSGYLRTVDGRDLETNPHSFYLQTFLRTGLVGVGALVLLLGMTFMRLVQKSSEEGPLSANHLLLLLVMQAVWFLTWPPGAEQGIVLGLAIGTTAAPARVRRNRLAPDSRRLVGTDRAT